MATLSSVIRFVSSASIPYTAFHMTLFAKIALAIVGLFVIVGVWLGVSYNGLVTANEGVKTKFADLDAQYQRRMDLIPNVVETVKGSAKFEQSTLEAVVAARSAWATAKSAGDIDGQVNAANSFDSALSRLLVTVEAYPDLKSTQAFRDLTVTLEGSENRIAVARRDYNGAVQTYNLRTKRFPSNLVASMFGFEEAAFFQAEANADQAPKVTF